MAMHSTAPARLGEGLGALPLKQFEVVLLNAEKVLTRFFELPVGPNLCLEPIVRRLARQATTLVQRAAVCRMQRAWRRSRVLKSRTHQPPRKCKVSKAAKEMDSQARSARASDEAKHKPQKTPAAIECPSEPTGCRASQHDVSCSTPPQKVTSSLLQNAQIDTSRKVTTSPLQNAKVDASRTVTTSPLQNAQVDASKPSLRRSATPDICKEKAAVNPIEKRRQMVVSQLAAVNPKRLARNRRLELEKEASSQATTKDAECNSSRQPTDSAVDEGYGNSNELDLPGENSAFLQPPEMSSRERCNSRNRQVIAEQLACDTVDSPSNRSFSHLTAMDSPSTQTAAWAPSPPSKGQTGPRRPVPASVGRSAPIDLLLKEDDDDDPLECRIGSAGFSMAPPSPGSWPQNKKFATPPGTASTMEPLGTSGKFSFGGSLSSGFFGQT